MTFTEKRGSKRARHIKTKENRMYQVVPLYIFHRVILGVSVYKTEIVVDIKSPTKQKYTFCSSFKCLHISKIFSNGMLNQQTAKEHHCIV